MLELLKKAEVKLKREDFYLRLWSDGSGSLVSQSGDVWSDGLGSLVSQSGDENDLLNFDSLEELEVWCNA